MRRVAIEPMESGRFAPFGSLLVAPAEGLRQDHAARLENARPHAAANLALIRSEPHAPDAPLRRLERHPHSTQAFLPLSVEAYLVVVAPDCGGRPDEAGLIALRVPGHVGLVYRRGVWHAHMTTLGAPGVFAMLAHEDGAAQDCVFAAIAPVLIGADG